MASVAYCRMSSRASTEHLAAARAVAARMAATAVLAGRSAAAAVRSPKANCSAGSFANDVANRAMAAAALRAVGSIHTKTANEAEMQNCIKASNLDPFITDICHDRPINNRPIMQGCSVTRVPTATDSERDDTQICEWDVKVQRTFITVVPHCPKLTYTAPCLKMEVAFFSTFSTESILCST